jgi:hypothetical protein
MSEWGTIAVDRGLFGHPVFADEPLTEREAWIWMIGQAAFRPHERRIGRARVKLARGELAAATRFMAEKWQWSEASVRRFLAKLEAESMISVRNDADLTQITICNYEAYQTALDERDAEVTQTRRKEEERIDSRDRDDARAREASPTAISPEADALAHDFLLAIGIDPKNPELDGMSGVPYAAAVWIARGYDRALVVATAAEVAARYGPRKPLSYYLKCFETAHRQRASAPPTRQLPLPQVVGGTDETARRTGTAGWQQRRDAARDAHAELKERLRAEPTSPRRGESG